MKKFAIAAATATALTLTLANAAFADTAAPTQKPLVVAAGEVAKVKEETSDTWITTKVKSDLVTEKGIPGTDITVETNHGVVSLSSKNGIAVTEAQKTTAVTIAKKVKGVKAVSADGLKAQ